MKIKTVHNVCNPHYALPVLRGGSTGSEMGDPSPLDDQMHVFSVNKRLLTRAQFTTNILTRSII